MDHNSTPKPESEEYDIEHPQNLNIPKFNSDTEKLEGAGRPGVEHLNDADENPTPDDSDKRDTPETDLGNNPSDDEGDSERIIRR
jgi:hypothetical protein